MAGGGRRGGGRVLWCFFLCLAVARRRRRRAARLVLWGGEARAARHGKLAGQVMLDFTDSVVCRADGFYLGRPAPVLAIEDRLLAGRTYVVVPVDRLPQGYDALITAASLAALCYDRGAAAGSNIARSGPKSPFEYVKGDDGRTVIKVTPEYIVGAITAATAGRPGAEEEEARGALCSTPELRKHYEQLVGAARGARAWSPRLETISERKARRGVAAAVSPGRLSPVAVRLLGLHRGEG